MSGYTKLFSTITDSTIWQAPDTTRLVWITMLAMADAGGYVAASVPGLAARARVSVPDCVTALETFKAPDEWSRTPDFEGRRVAVAEGGWVLLNHEKYRALRDNDDRREQARQAMARLRSERKNVLTPVNDVNHDEPQLTQADSYSSSSADSSSSSKALSKSKPKVKSISAKSAEKPADVDANIWADFVLLRKTKKAPLTETALKGIERETAKAGISLEAGLRMACERGWQGFKADWVNGSSGHSNQAAGDEAKRLIFGNQEKDITDESERI